MAAPPTILNRLLTLALAVALPCVAVIGFGLYRQLQAERDWIQRDLRLLRELNASQVSRQIQAARTQLARLAAEPCVQLGRTDECIPLFRAFLESHPDYANIGLVNQQGRVIAVPRYQPADPATSLLSQPHFAEGIRADDFHISAPFVGIQTKRWSCSLSYPVTHEGVRTGTLLLPLNLTTLATSLVLPVSAEGFSTAILDRNGTIVLRLPDPDAHIGKPLPNVENFQRAVAAGQTEDLTILGLDGEPRKVSAQPLPDTPWVVTTAVPLRAVQEVGMQRFTRAAIVVGLILGLAAALVLAYARALSRPIAALASVARGQAAGHTHTLASLSGPAEIADTARAFNEMLAARAESQRVLQESELRYRTVIEQTGQMVYDLDVATMTVRWFGEEGVRRMTGYTAPELSALGVEGWASILAPEDRESAVARLRRCLATAEPCSAEYRLLHRDGTRRLVDERGVVLTDAQGKAVRMLGRMSDITEREHNLRVIEDNRRLLRQVIDLVPHFIFAKDWNGRFLLANESLARAYRTTTADIVGRSDADFDPNAREVSAFLEADRAVIASGQLKLIPEESMTDASGQTRTLSTIKIPFTFPGPDGDIRAVLGVAVDITDLKRAQTERQQIETKLLETQKLESLGLLAGGIAHDFNNLLTGILGNAGLARLDAPAGWRGLDSLQGIEKAALRAADLCKQMLAYSGKGRFVIQRIDLNELLTDTTQLLQISINKKASLRFNLAQALPPIQADASQMRQVVMNLVINAAEALGEKGGSITLSTSRCRADADYLSATRSPLPLPAGDYVCLEVGDDGQGMSRETVARIFDPFFTTKFTGRGLGLAAVQGIVRGHQGAIKVYSEPGRGTTFKLLFPAATGTAESLAQPASTPAEWRGEGRVLVVDDEESVRTVAVRLLAKLGFTPDVAVDGVEALERFKAAPAVYRLILLDLTMPRLDGEETFRQLRQFNPGVRVILMSGFNKVDAINRFIGRGLAGFVQKPFEVDTLSAEVRRVLEGPPPGSAST